LIPAYKIETWTGANKDYTITDEAISIYFKEALTNQVGHFEFWVPTVKGKANPYHYGDIALNDTVKIWIGYKGQDFPATPHFAGKVTKIEASLSMEGGYVRRISGLGLGRIVLNRLKKNKLYSGISASSVVTEWAGTDLGLGTEQIDPDAPSVELEVLTKSYFDLLRWISDYWVDAATQIKKDFYVAPCSTHISGDLVWKSRPFRTSGVDSLTIGTNIERYQVTRSEDQVRNSIMVYGAREKCWSGSVGKDGWCESTTNWAGQATPSLSSSRMYGDYSIQVSVNSISNYIQRTNLGGVKAKFRTGDQYPYLRFCLYWTEDYWGTKPYMYVSLWAPDISNRFDCEFSNILQGTEYAPAKDEWHDISLPLGPKCEGTGLSEWKKVGSPNWENLSGFKFYLTWLAGSGNITIRVDGLHFYGASFSGFAEDSTSQMNYGRKDLEFMDEKLRSDSDCEKRAQTMLYQLKDPPIQLDVIVKPGSNNLLIGDRIPMTIPAEGISAQNFDIISVEQFLNAQAGLTSRVTIVNTPNIRQTTPLNRDDLIMNMQRFIKQLNLEERRIS